MTVYQVLEIKMVNKWKNKLVQCHALVIHLLWRQNFETVCVRYHLRVTVLQRKGG